ncbi:HupE/UreJ family protein [Enhygromyxa salina]|uniref:HupE / UreJ protein n=1 Tax=Enhygromyxa salina TaxID=215803 RepID=A0A2S9YKK2_9BACT|nr:HupE/UreJ family protein [Enhygromyxa salina]PRQ05536.1 HupE / UreJ protein [Enhygromyxa salina]
MNGRSARVWLALGCALACLLLVWPHRAWAHEPHPALLVIEQTASGSYEVRWRAPVGGQFDDGVRPVFPEHCELTGQRLACDDPGLTGELTIAGLARADADVVVEIRWSPTRTQTAVLSRQRPAMILDPGVVGGPWRVARAYVVLGVEHIVGGWDHLAFVVGLLLLVGFERRLIWTITAFTVAHSLTLAASVLELVRLPSRAVEIVIALSIVLVAREAIDARSDAPPSWSRRWPWAIAFGFGLLHGFGFAGALLEIGIPDTARALALASFNIGVELGQLAVVAVLGLAWVAVRRLAVRWPGWRVPVCVALGGLGVYWTLDRAASAWFGV